MNKEQTIVYNESTSVGDLLLDCEGGQFNSSSSILRSKSLCLSNS